VKAVTTPAAALAAAILVVGSGCGGDSTSDTTGGASPGTAQLTKCRRGKGVSAAGWNGSVAGISCVDAGRLIRDRFITDLYKATTKDGKHRVDQLTAGTTGAFSSAGFECDYEVLANKGGWQVNCAGGPDDAAVAFSMTP
jgi:hypothetical protein